MKQIQQLAHDIHTLEFISSEQGSNLGGTMAECVGIKNPNIKKCTLSSTPEAPCMDVSPSASPQIATCNSYSWSYVHGYQSLIIVPELNTS